MRHAWVGYVSLLPIVFVNGCTFTASPSLDLGSLQGSLTVNASSVPADGASSATANVAFTGVSGDLSGLAVTLSGDDGAGHVSNITLSTDGNGMASAPLISATPGSFTFTAAVVLNGHNLDFGSAVVEFTPVQPVDLSVSASLSTLTTSGAPVVADGTSAAQVRVTARDAQGGVLTAVPVALTATGYGNTLASPQGTTDSSGVFSTTIVTSVAGVKTITATLNDGAVTLTAAVTFVAGAISTHTSSWTLKPTTLPASGTDTASLFLLALDANGNPVPNQAVTVTASDANVTIDLRSGASSTDGYFSTHLHSRHAGTFTIVGTAGPVVGTFPITFTPTVADATRSTFTASPNSLLADGSTQSTLTLTALDANGNPVPNLSVAIAGGPHTLIDTVAPMTNANGVCTTHLASSYGGVDTVTATFGGITLQQNITFVVPACSADLVLSGANLGFAAGDRPSFIGHADLNGDGNQDMVICSSTFSSVTALLVAGDATVKSYVSVLPNTTPAGIVLGDFTGDGVVDIAATAGGAANISVAPGNGNGTFQLPITTPLTGSPYALTAGYFNSDAYLDLVVGDSADSNVTLLLGRGNGLFQTPLTYASVISPMSMAAGDVNGDGVVDVVAASGNGNMLAVHLTDPSTGTLSPALMSTILNNAVIAVGYIDKNSYVDVVAFSTLTPTSSILLGSGTGTFVAAGSASTGLPDAAHQVQLVDLNRDGNQDILVAAATHVATQFGNGNGSFSAPSMHLTGSSTANATAVDITGDGRPEIEVVNNYSPGVEVLANNPNGVFPQDHNTYAGNYTALVASDIDGDGQSDLMVGSANAGMFSLLSSGDGNFTAGTSYFNVSGNRYIIAMAGADFNNDGVTDYLAQAEGSLLNLTVVNGSGRAITSTNYSVSGAGAGDVSPADFDGDGHLDVASLNESGDVFTVLFGDGAVALKNPTSKTTGTGAYALTTADLNRDGNAEVITVGSSPSGNISVFSYANTAFSQTRRYNTSVTPRSVTAADIDADGYVDVVMAGANSIQIWLGDDSGDLSLQQSLDSGVTPSDVVAADTNNDGVLDLVVADGGLSIYRGTALGFAKSNFYTAFGEALAVGVGDFNGDGRQDFAVADYANGWLRTSLRVDCK